MRLWELFEDITAGDVKRAERELDTTVYQPMAKMKAGNPVIDLDLPTGSSHFMQRIDQRAAKANITMDQIKNLLARAKSDPKFGYKDQIDALSKQENPNDTIELRDPDNLVIPVVVKPNRACDVTRPGLPVCATYDKKLEPRNKMIAKTIFRKGVQD